MSRTGPKVPDNSADDGHSAPPAALAKRCLANVITAGEPGARPDTRPAL